MLKYLGSINPLHFTLLLVITSSRYQFISIVFTISFYLYEANVNVNVADLFTCDIIMLTWRLPDDHLDSKYRTRFEHLRQQSDPEIHFHYLFYMQTYICLNDFTFISITTVQSTYCDHIPQLQVSIGQPFNSSFHDRIIVF